MGDANTVIDAINRFKDKGWMPAFSGAIALTCNITEKSKKIYLTPDNTAGKPLTPNDLFLLRDLYGSQDIRQPLNQLDDESIVMSRWTPLFLEIFSQFPEAQAVAQVSTKWTTLASRLALVAWKKTAETQPNILRLSHWALLERINVGKELMIPIINYGSPEGMLHEARGLLEFYSQTCALLIRDYGLVAWGESLRDVENKIEILEHLCELQIHSYTLLSPPTFV
jgi:ribulose-5-phosphate 4-epimerase/fuculose-1-phosphate aldolase